MWYNEIGLCVQGISTILGSIVNTFGRSSRGEHEGLCDHLKMEDDFHSNKFVTFAF